MKTEGQMKWYQCKKDFSITVIILLIFGIAMLHFDIYENFRKNVWVAFKIKTGLYPNMIIDIFFEWGMWLPTLAVFIESIFICLKHYWSWLLITIIGVSFFLTIYSSNNLEGTMQVIGIIRCEFSNMESFMDFSDGVFMYVILSSPYVALVSAIVFAIRKNSISNQRR